MISNAFKRARDSTKYNQDNTNLQNSDKVQLNRRTRITTVTHAYLTKTYKPSSTKFLLSTPTFEQLIDALMEPKKDTRKPVLVSVKKSNSRWFEQNKLQANPRNHDKPNITRNEAFQSYSDENLLEQKLLEEKIEYKFPCIRFPRFTVKFGNKHDVLKSWDEDKASSFKVKIGDTEDCTLEYGDLEEQKTQQDNKCEFFAHDLLQKYEFEDFERFRVQRKIVRKACRGKNANVQ